MSNKNVNYKNSNNKNFINNTQKPKKKKFSLSQKIVLILMIFWTVCSCLSVFATAQSCSIAKADDSSISTVSDISDTVFNPLDYPSANLIDIDKCVGKALYKDYFNDYYIFKSSLDRFSEIGYSDFILPIGYYYFSCDFVFINSNYESIGVILHYDDDTEEFINIRNGTFLRRFLKPVIGYQLYLQNNDINNAEVRFKNLMVQFIGSDTSAPIYPYQPYFGDIYKAGEEVGKQQALDSANYGYFYNATVDITVNKTDGSTVNLNGLVPDYVYGGISFNSIYSNLISDYGSSISSIRLGLRFANDVSFQTLFTDMPFYGSGNVDFFNNITFFIYPINLNSPTTAGFFQTDSEQSYKFTLIMNYLRYNKVSYVLSEVFPVSYLSNLSFFISNPAYQLGYEIGYSNGEVSSDSYNTGYNNGKKVGYQDGYSAGVNGANQYSFLSLLGAVVDAPVSVLSDMLNFDLLGFNMSSFFFALITLGLIIAVIRIFI